MASKYTKYSTHEQVYANNLWQDYTGASWSKLSAAYYPDNRGAYSEPLGKNSSSKYRPKSLFFSFNRTYSSKLSLKEAIVVMHTTKHNNNEYPSLNVYVGNSKAPYKKSPVCTVKKPYKTEPSDYENGVHIYYKLTNIELKNLKNLICVFNWSRSKTSNKSLVKCGWVGINVYTEKASNKISISSLPSTREVTLGNSLKWKLTAKQNGTNGTAVYKINLPSNCKVVSKSCKGGTLSGNKWTVNLDKGDSSVLTYELQPYAVGYYEMNVANYSTGAIYVNDYFSVSEYDPSEYGIHYTFYNDVYERSTGYYEVKIINYAYDTSQISYSMTATMDDVDVISQPFLKTVEILEDSHNISNGLEDGEQTINFTPDHIGEYCLHLKVAVWTSTNGLVKVLTGTEKGSFEILPITPVTLNIKPSNNIDKGSLVTAFIGAEGIHALVCKPNRHNFLQINDESLSVDIENPPSYIGCVRLSRAHSNEGGANVTNSLIEERYRNRVYMGKKGDYDEEIPMKLRIPPEDVTTLEGLVEFDKPVPIDIIPSMKDGNPLNHRGWAELYKVSNIKKINERLYDCEPSVKYLTHEINTEFQVTKDKAVYPTGDEENYPTVFTYLSNVHNYADKLTDVLTPSPLGFYYDAEVEGGYAGVYEVPANNSIIFTSKVMQPFGQWNVKFRNTLPSLYSEDYDSNWKMAIRLKDSESNQVLFEHMYHTFKHFDDDESIVNKCKVTDTFWNGESYETVNYSEMHLNKDNFAPEIDSTKSDVTIVMNKTISSGGSITITRGDYVTFNLSANNGSGYVGDKVVNITLQNNLGYTESFEMLTDLYGNVTVNDYVEGETTATVEFSETEEFKSASATFYITTDDSDNKDHTAFSYTLPDKVTEVTDTLEVVLNDDSDVENPSVITGAEVYYSFCSLSDSKYSAPLKLTTDSEGKVIIPLQYNNGTQNLKLFYKGDSEYCPCLVTELITIEINEDVYKIEADDMEYAMYGGTKQFSGIVTHDDSPITNQLVTVRTYSNMNSNIITQTTTTNENGVFTVDLNTTYGLWFVDAVITGTENNATTSVTKTIRVVANDLTETSFIYDNNYTLIKDGNFPDGLFKVQLVTSTGTPITYNDVTFSVKDAFLDEVINLTLKTDEEGYIVCPWYSETEDVTVEFSYSGGIQYEPCNGSARITRASSNSTVDATWSYIPNQLISVNSSKVITDVMNTKDLLYSISNGTSNVNNIQYMCIVNNSIVFYGNTKKLSDVTYGGEVGKASSTIKTTLDGGINLREAQLGGNSCDVKIFYKDLSNVIKGGLYNEKVDLSQYQSQDLQIFSFSKGDLEGTSEDEICYQNYSVSSYNGGDLRGLKVCLNSISEVINSSNVVKFPLMREDLIEECKSIEVSNSSIWLPKYQSGEGNNTYLCGLKARSLPAPNLTIVKIAEGSIQDIVVTVNPSQVYSFDVEVIHISSNEKYSLTLKTTDNGVNRLKLLTHKTGEWLITFKFNNTSSNYGQDVYQYTTQGSSLTTTYSNSLPMEDDKVVVDPSNNLGETFGSDVSFDLNNGILNMVDYGMVINTNYLTGGKIFVDNYELNSQSLIMEIEVFYDNILQQRIYPLEGLLQLQVYENTQTTAEDVAKYQNLVCSPSPVPDNYCRFTRHTSDGTVYFFDSTLLDSVNSIYGVKYIGCPYNQFKGGCDLKTSNGISIFNLSNGYSPVYLDNGLVKIGFHRYSGYVEIYRYDENDNDFCFINAFKIDDNPKLRLKDNGYSDDKITVLFGDTEWSIWRGKPYIQVLHKSTDIKLLNLNDRLICEKTPNSEGKTFIEDYDTYMSKFSPFNSVQKFNKDLHIGEDIREDAFDVEALNDSFEEIGEPTFANIKLAKDSRFEEFAITYECERDPLNSVVFPSNGSVVEKPSDKFSLLVSNIYGIIPALVICKGYNSSDSVTEVWSERKDITPEIVETKEGVDYYKFLCSWENVPASVKYIEFSLVFTGEGESTFNRMMLYDGVEVKEWSRDDSIQKASESTINFDKTCFAELFNDKDDYGLGVVRPHKTSLNMRYITASPLTLLVPYLKQAKPCDKIENLIIEYINSYEQVVSIESIGGYL